MWKKPLKKVSYLGYLDYHGLIDLIKYFSSTGYINDSVLKDYLEDRLWRFKIINPKSTTINLILQELKNLEWISSKSTPNGYKIISEIVELSNEHLSDLYYSKQQELYILPGFFVDRLWKISPKSGQIFVPRWASEEWQAYLQTPTPYMVLRLLKDKIHQSSQKFDYINIDYYHQHIDELSCKIYEYIKKIQENYKKVSLKYINKVIEVVFLNFLFSSENPLTGENEIEDSSIEFFNERSISIWENRFHSMEIAYSCSSLSTTCKLFIATSKFLPKNQQGWCPLPGNITNITVDNLVLSKRSVEGFPQEKFEEACYKIYTDISKDIQSVYIPITHLRDRYIQSRPFSPYDFEILLSNYRGYEERQFNLALETDTDLVKRTDSRIPIQLDKNYYHLIAFRKRGK